MREIFINEHLISVIDIKRNLHLKESDRYILLNVMIQWKVLNFVDRNKNELWELLCTYNQLISEINVWTTTDAGRTIQNEIIAIHMQQKFK